MVPNGVSTGLDIGLSNYSLMLITLSFYTMCKSTTPVFLLTFAFIWGIERCASCCAVIGRDHWQRSLAAISMRTVSPPRECLMAGRKST